MSKKKALIIAICLVSVLLIAGCTRNTVTPSPTPMVSPMTSPLTTTTPSMMPSPDMSPDTSPAAPSPSGSGADGEELTKMADEIAAEVDKLSEVDKASVVMNETTAIIGVKYDASYKGKLDERLTEMITEKAKSVDEKLTDVVVTDDPDVVDEIEDMRAKQTSGNVATDLKADFDSLINRIKPKV